MSVTATVTLAVSFTGVTDVTHLVFRDAADAHGGDGGEHHPDGDQAEELTGKGVTRILQSQPQTLPHVTVTHFLEVEHVSVTDQEEGEGEKGKSWRSTYI